MVDRLLNSVLTFSFLSGLSLLRSQWAMPVHGISKSNLIVESFVHCFALGLHNLWCIGQCSSVGCKVSIRQGC